MSTPTPNRFPLDIRLDYSDGTHTQESGRVEDGLLVLKGHGSMDRLHHARLATSADGRVWKDRAGIGIDFPPLREIVVTKEILFAEEVDKLDDKTAEAVARVHRGC